MIVAHIQWLVVGCVLVILWWRISCPPGKADSAVSLKTIPPVTPLPIPVNFATLRMLNHDRIGSFGNARSPAGLVACIAEEHGEVAACVLGLTGEKKRKEHLTVRDLGYELADVVTYCDLLADQYGIDLGEAVREKFNIVSARVGYGKVWQ